MMSLEFLRHLKSSQTSQENFSLWNKPVTNTDARFTSDVCSIVLTRLSRCNLVKSKPISTGLNQFMLLAITISISDYNCWYLVSVLVKLHQEKAWEMQGTTNSHQKKRKGEIPPGQNGTAIREKHEKTLNYSFKYIWSFLGWLRATYRTNCRQYKPLQQPWSC